MTEPIPSVGTDPWANSPSKPSMAPQLDPEAQRRSQARAVARDRRRARWYGHYWAVVTALFALSAVGGLAHGDGWGLFALLLAGATGWYARYLYRGGQIRFLIIPIPWF